MDIKSIMEVSTGPGLKQCFHPQGCDNPTVKAHSISKRYLKMVAEEGHLVALQIRAYPNDRINTIEKVAIGVNLASTFTGLCHIHDSEYRRVDERHLPRDRQTQCDLMFRMAIYHRWLAGDKVYRFQRYTQQIGFLDIDIPWPALQAMEDEADDILSKLHKLRLRQAYKGIEHMVTEVEMEPNVVASGICHFVDEGFHVRVFYNILPVTGTLTLVVLSGLYQEFNQFRGWFLNFKHGSNEEKVSWLYRILGYSVAGLGYGVYLRPSTSDTPECDILLDQAKAVQRGDEMNMKFAPSGVEYP